MNTNKSKEIISYAEPISNVNHTSEGNWVTISNNLASNTSLQATIDQVPIVDSNSEGRASLLKKVKTRFKDTESDILPIIDLNQNGLRRLPWLNKNVLIYDNGNLVYNLFTNFITEEKERNLY